MATAIKTPAIKTPAVVTPVVTPKDHVYNGQERNSLFEFDSAKETHSLVLAFTEYAASKTEGSENDETRGTMFIFATDDTSKPCAVLPKRFWDRILKSKEVYGVRRLLAGSSIKVQYAAKGEIIELAGKPTAVETENYYCTAFSIDEVCAKALTMASALESGNSIFGSM